MSRIRDPARDKAYTLWKEAGGEEAPKGILKEIAQTLNISEGTLRGWKAKDKWNAPKKKGVERSGKNMERSNRKMLINQAKLMVERGSTIKEASTKTGINYSSLRDVASKENWIDRQEKYMQKVYGRLQGKLSEQHIEEIEEAVKSLSYLKKRTMKDIVSGEFENIKEYGTAIKNICDATDKQSKYLGLPEMKMYIRQDKNKGEAEEEEIVVITNVPKGEK